MDKKEQLQEVIERLDRIISELNYRSRSDLSFVAGDIEDVSEGTEYKYLVDAVYNIVDGIETLEHLVDELKKGV